MRRKICGLKFIIGGAVFVFAFFSFAVEIKAQETLLRPNTTFTFKDSRSKPYLFKIEAGKDHIISLEIKQNGMDVKVKLFDINGLPIAESDYPFSEQDIERIFIVADKAGTYRLEISSKFPGEKGSINLKLNEFRQALPEDFKRAEAEKLFSQAQALRITGKTADSKKAIEFFEQSLSIWQKVSDKTGEIRTLASLSFLNRRVGNNEKSLKQADNILQFADFQEYQTYKSDAFYQIAQIQFERGEITKAFVSYQSALSVFSETSPKQVNVLATMAYAYQTTNEFEFAQEALDKAVENIRRFPDIYNEAQTFHVFGLYEFNSNEFYSAIGYFKKAADLRGKFGNRRGQAISLTFLGMSYQSLKQYDEALEIFQKTLPISRELGDVENQLDTLLFIAQICKEKGDVKKSFDYYGQGIALYNGRDSNNLKALYLSQGAAYRQMSNFTESRKSLDKALALYQKTGDIGGVATTLYQTALLESLENNLDKAKNRIEHALQIHEYEQAKYKNRRRLSSFLETRRRYFDLYIDVLMRLDEQRPNEGFALKALQISESARMRTLIWQYREAVKNTPQAVDFQLLTQIQKNRQQLGEQFSLLAKAQSNAGQSARIPDIEKTIADLNKQDESLKAQLRQSNPSVAGFAQPPTLSLAEMQNELDDETVLVEYSLGEQRSYLWIVSKTGFQSFTLPKRAEIDAQAKSFYETLNPIIEPATNRTAVKKTKTAKIIVAENKDAGEEADKLSRLLVVEKLANLSAKRLVIVADGALNLIPFASLKISERFIAEKFETVQLPSLTTLHVLREANIKPFAPNSLAIIADPVFSGGDERLAKNYRLKNKNVTANSDLTATLRDFNLTTLSRLPFTRIEAEKISQNSTNKTTLNLDFKANRERLLNGEFDRFDILHFATHGFLNNQHPELSGLVLSLTDEKGNQQNGFLRTQDLYLLKIKPQMVVLSACQTGLGTQVENEGLIGLTRGFLAIGTPRIIATLWKVDDAATAEFMSRFYRAMLKENQVPSAALKTAQNEIRRISRFNNPRYWAGFVLTGEWR